MALTEPLLREAATLGKSETPIEADAKALRDVPVSNARSIENSQLIGCLSRGSLIQVVERSNWRVRYRLVNDLVVIL